MAKLISYVRLYTAAMSCDEPWALNLRRWLMDDGVSHDEGEG